MKIELSKSQWEEMGNQAGWTKTAQAEEVISVPVSTLQHWALSLSQDDNSPRWEIEDLLTSHGHDTRDRRI